MLIFNKVTTKLL